MGESHLVIGIQHGDEGKGKVVDWMMALLQDMGTPVELAYRFNGANNAGHTLEHNGRKIILHQISSAIFFSLLLSIMFLKNHFV